MQREFIRNIAILLGINLLIKPVYIFGIDRTMQNHAGTENWGWYATLLSFCYLFQMVNDFGIQNFNSRHISQNRQLLKKHFPRFLFIKTIFAILFLGVTHLLGMVFGYAPGWLFLVVALNLVITSFVLFLRSNIAGLGFYRTDSLLSALDKFLMIVIVGTIFLVPAWKASLTILDFALVQTVSLSVTLVIALSILFPYVQFRGFTMKKAFALMILRQMAPFALVTFLMTLYTRLDVVMIEKLLPNGKFEAGIYAAGFRLLDAANNVGFLMAGLLLPMFSRMLKTRENVNPTVLAAVRIIVPVAVAATGLLVFFGEEVMMLLHHPNATEYWGSVTGVVFCSFIAISLMYVFGTLLTAAGKLRQMNIVFFIGVLANVLLNWYLIGEYAALGAAWASLITQSGITLALIFLSGRLLDAGLTGGWWLRILVFGVVSWGLIWGASMLVNEWILAFITGGIAVLIWSLISRMIDISELRKILAARSGR